MMPVDGRLNLLNVLAGEWETTITMLDANGGDVSVSHARDVYSWSANGRFLQHDVDAEMDGSRFRSLEIIALDPAGDGFVSRSYDPDGTFSDFKAELEGRSWRIIGEVERFDGQFSEDGNTLSGRWEQNVEGKWSPLMEVTLRKR
jgi:hypothetical protein